MSGKDSVKGNKSRKTLKSKGVSSVTNFIDQLPEALLLEILIRLPCKPCFKCKSVSKRWFSLISQPRFIFQFLRLRKMTIGQRRRSSLSLLKRNNYVDKARYISKWCEKADEFPFTLVPVYGKVIISDRIFKSSGFSLNFLPPQQPDDGGFAYVVGSSNDLLLCSSSRFFQKDYYVCNPLTKQWIQLPQPPKIQRSAVVGLVSDLFIRFGDEEEEAVNLNFEGHYKVIRIMRGRTDNESGVEIFSSETGQWSESFATHLPGKSWHYFYPWPAGIVNCGTLYWWWRNPEGVTVYDPSQNCFSLIKDPDDVPLSGKMCGIGPCRGRIRMSHFFTDPYDDDVAPYFKVWELEDSISGKWQLVRKVDIWELNTCLNQESFDLVDIFIHPDDGDLVFLLFR